MKRTKKLLPAALLLFVVALSGCERKEQGIVEYKECNCEKMAEASLNITNEFAKMFIVNTEEEVDLLKQINQGGYFKYILYNKQTDISYLYNVEGAIIQAFRVCNFPNFAKLWNITDNGQEVYFEGTAYNSCQELGGIANISYFDYILTYLKKK